MAISEFDLIARFFAGHAAHRDDVVLGIGDDAAVLRVPAERELVVAVDTLLAGRHFPASTSACDIGFKSLAVNLSDLAAMGAQPAWATLSLTLPEADEVWLQDFASGFFQLADRFGVALVGGDTTRGLLSVTVQVHGFVEAGKALRRDRARPGQKILVTGTLGDAAYALTRILAGQAVDADLLARLNRPEPRVAFGLALLESAAAAIDISDGLLADLGHVLDASGCGASVAVDRLPRSVALAEQSDELVRRCQLSGGDDYELCFTVDADKVQRVREAAATLGVPVTEIGLVESERGLRCRHDDGSVCATPRLGFDHFA